MVTVVLFCCIQVLAHICNERTVTATKRTEMGTGNLEEISSSERLLLPRCVHPAVCCLLIDRPENADSLFYFDFAFLFVFYFLPFTRLLYFRFLVKFLL